MTEKKWQSLTDEEARVILDKGTEAPFSNEYYKHDVSGVYCCRQCQQPLYRSLDKFDSQCGWPSFDDDVIDTVIRQPDVDGLRTEIICRHCQGHLGHVFSGEHHTEKNTRHCVNSLSIQFISIDRLFERALAGDDVFAPAMFAAGCFWGVEQQFSQQPGVLATQVGYAGGTVESPSYDTVCQGTSGHAETLRLIYHQQQTDYQQLVEFFFSMHNATQHHRQGPDIGSQYRSAIFYFNDDQKQIAEQSKQRLIDQGTAIVTEITAASPFWPAEEYHQRYHNKHSSMCHTRKK